MKVGDDIDAKNSDHLTEDKMADYYARGVLVEGCLFCEKIAD